MDLLDKIDKECCNLEKCVSGNGYVWIGGNSYKKKFTDGDSDSVILEITFWIRGE